MSLESVDVQCPYCWENIQIEVEVMDDEQRFIQDCSVCCRPIQFVVSNQDGEVEVSAGRSD